MRQTLSWSQTKEVRMVKATIELEGEGERWRVKDTYVNYDDQQEEQMGPIDRWLEYEEAVKEAKRWAMLKLRHQGRRETEEDVTWKVTPQVPLQHVIRL
jgi:hypothetical protein